MKKEETENNCWYTFLLVPSIVFYLISLVGIILMFVFFTSVSSFIITIKSLVCSHPSPAIVSTR